MGLSSSILAFSKEHHIPTPEEVYEVRRVLIAYVPAELANKIIDDARYWPKVSYSTPVPGDKVRWAAVEHHGPVCPLVTPRLSDWIGLGEPVHIKEVHFKIKSHDQGWCNQDSFPNRYEGSWTWFEAAIIRDLTHDPHSPKPDDIKARIEISLDTRTNHKTTEAITVKNPENDSDVWHIQRNVRASGTPTVHKVKWTDMTPDDQTDEGNLIDVTGAGRGAGFIRLLGPEDRIAVIARAKYSGWANFIISVEVEVFYAV